MCKDRMQERALEFLDWIDHNYDDWATVSCAVGLLDVSELDAINILKKAYENGLVEIFFTYFMNVQETKAIPEAREKYILRLLRNEIENVGIEQLLKDYEQQLQERCNRRMV